MNKKVLYLRKLIKINNHEKTSTFKLKNNIIKGKITGVNADGLLIITFKKQIKEFNLKEIQMIL